MVIAALAAILSFGFMIKGSKAGVYMYKGAVFIVLMIVLFVALFFYLGSNADVNALNTNLHPWKNYILPRVLASIL